MYGKWAFVPQSLHGFIIVVYYLLISCLGLHELHILSCAFLSETKLLLTYYTAFREMAVPLLRRGWVLAHAHVRGGGERGPAWHAAARGLEKMSSFTDLEVF